MQNIKQVIQTALTSSVNFDGKVISSCIIPDENIKNIFEIWSNFINIIITKSSPGLTSSTTVDERKVKYLEKEYNMINEKYKSLNKSVVYLQQQLQAKEKHNNQLSKVADDLHQVIAQKNRDIKRLKDMFFIEFNNKNNSIGSNTTCPSCGFKFYECDVSKNNSGNCILSNLNESNSEEFHTDSFYQSIHQLTSKNTLLTNPIESIYYPEKIFVPNNKKLNKPKNIPPLDLAKINDYNSEYINKEDLDFNVNKENLSTEEKQNLQLDNNYKNSNAEIKDNSKHKQNQSVKLTKTILDLQINPNKLKKSQYVSKFKDSCNFDKQNDINKSHIKLNKVDPNSSLFAINKVKSLNIKDIINPNKINLTTNNTKSNVNSKNFNFHSNATTIVIDQQQSIKKFMSKSKDKPMFAGFVNEKPDISSVYISEQEMKNQKLDLDKTLLVENRTFHNSIGKDQNKGHNLKSKDQSHIIDLKKASHNYIKLCTSNLKNKDDKANKINISSSSTKLNLSFNIYKKKSENIRAYKSQNNSLSKIQSYPNSSIANSKIDTSISKVLINGHGVKLNGKNLVKYDTKCIHKQIVSNDKHHKFISELELKKDCLDLDFKMKTKNSSNKLTVPFGYKKGK